MVKHIVTFKFKGEDSVRKEYALKFKEALMALPAVIPCLESMEVGINENPAETWDLVLTAIVPTMADVEVYAKHPAHVAAASIIGPVKDSRACVDYEF
ncbi:MAG: Dabb family protein [Muribaculaceae bacterium]|nr:Dabb family protein [Muribaculaceae bacterium]